ncbi:Serine/threonine protein kinase [Pedococcus cremeus]|uniref:Serine/threonine protein kinase n=2 Tax=Pedococcus cremeus TaxID=587636 RepID=A0A1H9SY63_9MICO|nr:Serine/threonine protein kinase [Pedococcus cremeus]
MTNRVPAVPGYDLHERLGAGASSVVWRATRRTDGAEVAVKLVTTWGEGDCAVREVEVLRSLPAEGLVRVHEAFSLPDDPSRVAVVLDLVSGGSLGALLAARGHLTAGEAVTLVTPVARTLGTLHAAGVVHADVSPGNVLLERSGRPLLADLGVARLVGEAPGEVVGTPGFTAPEVEAGEQPTSASDVYAVGAVAWACVTGGPPAPLGIRRPLAELVPALPSAWAEVVTQCLSSQPSERPSAAEVALRLFDAAPCEPLRLVVGDDEVSLITHRLRSAAPTVHEVAGEPVRSPERWVARLRWRSRPAGRRGQPSRVRLAPLGAAGGLLLVAALVLAGRAAGWRERAQAAEPVSRPAATRSVPPTPPAAMSPTATVAPATPPTAAQDRQSPRSRPADLVQALADVRSEVLVSGDDRGLARLDVPDSAAWRADAALLRELRSRGERYEDLRFRVRSADLLSSAGERAALRCRVDTSAHDVVGRDGATRATRAARAARATRATSRPAERGAPLVLNLRWSDGRWRIESIATA